jgi:Domain of unknown function (DUF5671)
MILRRLYFYLVSAAALSTLAVGVSVLGWTLLVFAFNDPAAQDSRTSLAGFMAMTLVALPVWAVHFWFANRSAHRDAAERTSAIRRLYVYWACLVMSVGATITLSYGLAMLLRPVLEGCPSYLRGAVDGSTGCTITSNWLVTTQLGWVALVLFVIWAFHFRVAAGDRSAVGETGSSATLRRWYTYTVLLIGLLMVLSGASSLIQVGWLKARQSDLATFQYLGDPAGQLLAGLVLWGFHARYIAKNHLAEDRHATLRALGGFVVVAVSIGNGLFGASLILYIGLARALGIQPAGAEGDVINALALPTSMLLVYGIAWVLVSRRLTRDAAAQEADRQAGIRRLYTNLVALVSLVTWAGGAGGLLWTLAEQLEAPIIGVKASDWRTPVSFSVTLLIVGGVVWLAYWRHSPWAVDRQSLSRRLYVWAALLASVLAVLWSGIAMLNVVLQQVVSATPRVNTTDNLEFGHWLAVLVVAAAVGIYHWRVLRADAAARPPKPGHEAASAPAHEVAPPAAAVPAAIPAPVAAPRGKRYILSVVDASEDDLHQALATLPPQASYHLTPESES